MSVLWLVTKRRRCECSFADQSANLYAHPLRSHFYGGLRW